MLSPAAAARRTNAPPSTAAPSRFATTRSNSRAVPAASGTTASSPHPNAGWAASQLQQQTAPSVWLQLCRLGFHQLPTHLHVPHALGDHGGQKARAALAAVTGSTPAHGASGSGNGTGNGTGTARPPPASTTPRTSGTATTAGSAAMTLSGTTAGAGTAAGSGRTVTGSAGTATRRRAASTSPRGASSMRARKGRAIGATSTRRTSAARRRRRPARMAPRRERSRTARSEGPRRDVLLWNRRGGGDVSFWFYFVFSSCFFSQGKRAWLWVSSEAHRSGLSRGCTCS